MGTLGSFQAGDYTGFGADAGLREPGDGPQQLRGVDAQGSLHAGNLTWWVMMLTIEKTTGVPVKEESCVVDLVIVILLAVGEAKQTLETTLRSCM